MKELIKTIVIILLIIAVGYFFYQNDKLVKQVIRLSEADSVHAVTINEFDHNLYDLELQFKGRGKHIQQFQAALAQMNARLDSIDQVFATKIEQTNTSIAELKMDMESQFNNVKTSMDEQSERLTKFQRETNRTLTDIQTAISRMGREFSDLEKRVKTLETPPTPPKK